MSIANWATFSVSFAGVPLYGDYSSTNDAQVIVRSHKNVLHVLDEAAWRKGSHSHNVVAVIESGYLFYRDINIAAEQSPDRDGQYHVIWSGTIFDKTLDGMIGLSKYGSDIDGNWIGITQSDLDSLRDWLEQGVRNEILPEICKTVDFSKAISLLRRD